MIVAIHEVVPTLFFLAAGWLALWPLRSRLGAGWYHLASLPVGLLAGPLSGALSTVTRRPLDIASAFGGALLLAAAGWLVARFVAAPAPKVGPPVGPRSFFVAGGLIGALALLVGVLRLAAPNNDSIVGFWPMGVALSWNGAFTPRLMGSRAPLITTMNAIYHDFGSDFAFVIYPLFAVIVLGAVGLSLWTGPLSGARLRTKKVVTATTVAFLILEPSFIFNSFFVHTQMISAFYLLLAGTSLWLAFPKASVAEKGVPNDAFFVLGGFAASGLALTRPDGMAYMFVPVAIALSVLTISTVRWRSVLSFFVPMTVVILGTYAAAFEKLGLWQDPKLGGKTSLAILGVLILSTVAPWIIQWADGRLPFRVRGEEFLGFLVGVSIVVTSIILAIKWDTARGALATARINLLQGAGGYFYLWPAVVLLMVLTVFSGDGLRLRSWTRSPFLAVTLFFAIAVLIHGLSHEGRIGAGDSLNRVVFEVLPVIVWLAAAVVARIVASSDGGQSPGVAVVESV